MKQCVSRQNWIICIFGHFSILILTQLGSLSSGTGQRHTQGTQTEYLILDRDTQSTHIILGRDTQSSHLILGRDTQSKHLILGKAHRVHIWYYAETERVDI